MCAYAQDCELSIVSPEFQVLHARMENKFVSEKTHNQAHEARQNETSSLRRVIYAIGGAGMTAIGGLATWIWSIRG